MESLSRRKIHGTMQALGNGNGDIDIYTARDFCNPNVGKNGTLLGRKTYSQEGFVEHANAYSSKDNYITSAMSK